MQDDLTLNLQQQILADPLVKLQEQMRQQDPLLKLQQQMLNDPLVKLQEQMRQHEPLKLQQQILNDPLVKLLEQMRQQDLFLKIHQQMLNNPLVKLQEQMWQHDPFLKLHQQMLNNPLVKLQEQMRQYDPFLKLHQQMLNDPLVKLQEQMRQYDPFLKLQQQMLTDSLVKLQQQLKQHDPLRNLGEGLSQHIAMAFSIVAEQNSAMEELLVEDSDLPSIDPLRRFFLFVGNLYDVIFDRIQAAQSVSELLKIHNLITTVISAAALYYAMQSANTEDIDKMRMSVDRQTDVIREEAAASRSQMQEAISSLSQSVRQLTTLKAATLGYAVPYEVKRSVPIKAAKSLKAETVGATSVGQVVFVIVYEQKWVRIEALDLTTGEAVSGWVKKKTLKRIRRA